MHNQRHIKNILNDSIDCYLFIYFYHVRNINSYSKRKKKKNTYINKTV